MKKTTALSFSSTQRKQRGWPFWRKVGLREHITAVACLGAAAALHPLPTTSVIVHGSGEYDNADGYFNSRGAKLATFAPKQPVSSSAIDKRLTRLQSADSSDSSGVVPPVFSSTARGSVIPASTGGLSSSVSPPYLRKVDSTNRDVRLIKQDTQTSGSQSERDYMLSAGSSSIGLADSNHYRNTSVDALFRKKLPSSKAYFIARELLMTERTYVKDLNIITVHLKDAVSVNSPGTGAPSPLGRFAVLQQLFTLLKPLNDFHRGFLEELEQKIVAWEASSRVPNSVTASVTHGTTSAQQLTNFDRSPDNRIGDSLLCAAHNTVEHYTQYGHNLAMILLKLHECHAAKQQLPPSSLSSLSTAPLDAILNNFEERKLCYLPLAKLLLKPAYRLLIWKNILTRLVAYYLEEGGDSPDLSDCRVALDKISPITQNLNETVEKAENLAKLMELESDLTAVDNLVQPQRMFIREGCLQRFSRKGAVQRVFVLFDDCLVYANRTSAVAPTPTFKLHGQIPLRGLMLEDGDPFRVAVNMHNCFTIFGGNRSIIVSASSPDEKCVWMEEIRCAAEVAKNRKGPDLIPEVSTLKSINASFDDVGGSIDTVRSNLDDPANLGAAISYPLSPMNESKQEANHKQPGEMPPCGHRTNDTLHVCWHRCTTVGKNDIHKGGRFQLSGYLLRKFRNSSGWQKLWVVYGNFALYFYKSHTEDSPLASLPLLGYTVGDPAAGDAISKQNVFKLTYKSHFYFFRADSEYAYQRWIEVIRAACLMPAQKNPTVTILTE